jgi:hypothetical protein
MPLRISVPLPGPFRYSAPIRMPRFSVSKRASNVWKALVAACYVFGLLLWFSVMVVYYSIVAVIVLCGVAAMVPGVVRSAAAFIRDVRSNGHHQGAENGHA